MPTAISNDKLLLTLDVEKRQWNICWRLWSSNTKLKTVWCLINHIKWSDFSYLQFLTSRFWHHTKFSLTQTCIIGGSCLSLFSTRRCSSLTPSVWDLALVKSTSMTRQQNYTSILSKQLQTHKVNLFNEVKHEPRNEFKLPISHHSSLLCLKSDLTKQFEPIKDTLKQIRSIIINSDTIKPSEIFPRRQSSRQWQWRINKKTSPRIWRAARGPPRYKLNEAGFIRRETAV